MGRRRVYRRGQTVGSYGGYVNTHACSHKDRRVMEGFAIETKERAGRVERDGEENRKMTAGETSPLRRRVKKS